MPRNWSKAVPESNGPVPQKEEFGSDQPTLADVYRMIEKLFDKSDRIMDEHADGMRETKQRLASLEHDARKPRLAMEADVLADKKTYERTEGAAAAVQAKHGDSCSAKRGQADLMSSTSSGDDFTGPLAHPCSRGDALVGNGAVAPNSCLSPLEMRRPTAAGGLLPAGKTSTATRIIFFQPCLRFCPTEETNSRTTPIQYASYYSRFCRINNQLAAAFCRRSLKQNRGKLWYLIPAVLQIIYAPARFWERGAR